MNELIAAAFKLQEYQAVSTRAAPAHFNFPAELARKMRRPKSGALAAVTDTSLI